MMRSLLIAGALALMLPIAPLSAATIFADDFNRAASNTVGNGWTEYEVNGSDVAVFNDTGTACTGTGTPAGCNNALRLRDRGAGPGSIDAGVAQLGGLSAVGLIDIALSFDYKPLAASEGDDRLLAEWKLPSDSAWTILANYGLGGSSYASVSLSLGLLADGATEILLRLRTNVSDDSTGESEGVIIDNVLLAGTERPVALVSAVPLPAGLPLFATGLGAIGLLGWWRRRRTAIE